MGNIQSWLDKGQNDIDGEKAQDTEPQSAWGMVLTLGPVLATFLVLLTIFIILRKSQRRFYAPRTYLGSLREAERTPELPNGWFNWIPAFWKMPDSIALRHQTIDAYLFLRFLRVCTVITFIGACITWPVLFAVNATGGNNSDQLEVISYSNVNVDQNTGKNRLYAHALLAWVFYGFVMYMILRECIFYINLRQAFLLTPQNAKRISSRTVLFTSVPRRFLDKDRLSALFSDSVKNVWVVCDTNKVDDLVKERNKVAMKLEKAEIKLIKQVNKARTTAASSSKKGGADGAAALPPRDAEAGQIASRYIPANKRPSHRLGFLGLIGKKVDTIEWCRAELARLIPETDAAQDQYRAESLSPYRKGQSDNKIPAVFVEFFTQSDAEAAYQVLTHHQSLRMAPKAIGVPPSQVVWKSLKVSWWQKIVRKYVVLAFIAVLIIFWAIPVGVVGVISQVSTLVTVPGLTWLASLPDQVLGLIGGLLPPVALSILMSLVPVIMRACARLSGEVSDADVELFTQNAYFVFQLIQVFLIRTLADTASTLVVKLAQNPGSVFSVLSKAIPTSSNFYISYFMVQGFTIAANVITQISGFVVFTLLYKFLAKTPRAMYTKWTNLSAVLWGSIMPIYTNIAVISIVFAVIAPFMLFWASVTMGLFYLAYRYNILFVTSTNVDTRGLIYPRALKQLFSGVYIAEIAMVGMFAASTAWGPLVLMVVMLIFTILFHLTMKKALDPLLYCLPRTLQVEEEAARTSPDGGVVSGNPGPGGPEAVNSNDTTAPALKDNITVKTPANVAKKSNFVMRWLKPWLYADYRTLRDLVPHEQEYLSQYSAETEDNAYFPPSVNDATPILWIPEDAAGVSKEEIAHTSKVIAITDEGCTLDEKNKINWDIEQARPPIWEEKVYY